MENEIKSNKICLKKQFIIIWIILVAIFIINIVVSISSYSSYKKGQDLTATSLILSDELNGMGEFSKEKFEKDRKGTIKSMYNFLHPDSYYSTVYGRTAYRDLLRQADKVEDALNEILRKNDYNKGASYYLLYTGFGEYYIKTNIGFIVIYVVLVMAVIAINVFYIIDKKTEIIVNNELIICKKRNGKIRQTMLENIKSIEETNLKGLRVKGDSFKYKIILINNSEELKTRITEALLNNKKED